ncbi:glycan metabolism protein RagB [Dyadobacter frigoris]|uniref:RagB/SusD family nutrient uptake outer membrane protein n=1 Tax=Dyadobacter frigoris TaxID=2576211 RepID=UPI0024A22802|nr:RagB/SusD family nutrient uptake outer membrane protein [Dyadobacter frigoris]GLU57217.1 glycan metabolism protein RagB [Dyadobacter frigoris]
MKNRNFLSSAIKLMLLLVMLSLDSCQVQDDWLNVKRDKSDISPKTLDDFQAVLDNSNTVNKGYPMLGLTGTDNVYLPDNILGSVTEPERSAYTWGKSIYLGAPTGDYSVPYVVIEFCNIVLDGISTLPISNTQQAQYNNLKGQALFHRAMSLYNLSQLFCKPFNPSTAGSDPGLQLKVSSDPNQKVKRSSVKETYDFIISDLQNALTLLPQQQQYTTRPSKRAAQGLLAKVYLSMQLYQNALEAATASLGENPALLDFNSDKIKPNETFVFPPYSNQLANEEILYFACGQSMVSLWPVYTIGFADSLLYKSYDGNDLRKTLFFKVNTSGRAQFTGSYTGTYLNFSGIATNELLLIQAECLARNQQPVKSRELLDVLLVKRFKTGTYQKLVSPDNQVLALVLAERRKELAFTGQLRWEDLRRLNQDPVFAKTLSRTVNGMKVQILPNDNRYVFEIPEQEIQLTGVQQNIR